VITNLENICLQWRKKKFLNIPYCICDVVFQDKNGKLIVRNLCCCC